MDDAPFDVVFGFVGDVRRNSRALRQLRALSTLGCTVAALTLGPPPQSPPPADGLQLRVLPRPQGSGPLFFWRVHRLFRRVARGLPAHIYHASDLYTLPALHAAAQTHGSRLAYDARELYPHVASTAGRPWARWFWAALERYYIRQTDAVFTVSSSIADRLARAYGIPRPPVLHNVPPLQPIPASDALRQKIGISSDTVIILHQGNIQKDRGCARLTDALRETHGAVLVFLGGGPLKADLQRTVEAKGLTDRVFFLEPVPPDELLAMTASADIGVTLLADTCLNHRFALPNKLFEYLMAGLPVLASDLPEIRRVVQAHDVGRTVDPADRSALAAALQQMVDDAEARARWSANTPHVFETFSWEAASERFQHVYKKLLTANRAHDATS